jgi:hypothetical protein
MAKGRVSLTITAANPSQEAISWLRVLALVLAISELTLNIEA